ncbi:AbgT family transporter, partial [Lysobacter sp. D1-1-M9]|uniref:AbgT family transporter n=1 Tax=Novilysobacter longmucuonensis TaxID=3098603 RepID=UPI002FC91B71
MKPSEPTPQSNPAARRGLVTRFLDGVERVGNRLPDPAVLFLLLMIAVWVVSALMANMDFSEIDPRSGEPVVINNLLAGTNLTQFLATMVS